MVWSFVEIAQQAVSSQCRFLGVYAGWRKKVGTQTYDHNLIKS